VCVPLVNADRQMPSDDDDDDVQDYQDEELDDGDPHFATLALLYQYHHRLVQPGSSLAHTGE
jgi:hypothetical protein